VGRIKEGLETKLYLGNLKARRDWGYAPEYVEAMWRMIQQDRPDDLSSPPGKPYRRRVCRGSVFLRGVGLEEICRNRSALLPSYGSRPFAGDASKAKKALGWTPHVNFKELVRLMVDADLEIAAKKKPFTSITPIDGYRTFN